MDETLRFLGGLLTRSPEGRRGSSMVNTFLTFDRDGDGKVRDGGGTSAIFHRLFFSLVTFPSLPDIALSLSFPPSPTFVFYVGTEKDGNAC